MKRISTALCVGAFTCCTWINVALADLDFPENQVQVEAQIIETSRDFARELGVKLGLALPNGDMSDVAGTGIELGLNNRRQIANGIYGTVEATAAIFGSEDFGQNASSSVFALKMVPQVELFLKALSRRSQSGVISAPHLVTMNSGPAIVAGAGLYSETFINEFDDITNRYTSTRVGGFVGGQYTVIVNDNMSASIRARINQTFGEGNDDRWVSVNATLDKLIDPPGPASITHRAAQAVGSDLTIGLLLELASPFGDLANFVAAGPGIGVKVLKPIRDNVMIGGRIAFDQYMKRSSGGELESESISALRADITVEPHLNIIPHVDATGYVGLRVETISKRIAETAITDKSDFGTLIIGGLGVHQQVNDRVGIALLSDVPLLGFLFEGETPRDAKAELLVFLTPRIIEK